MCLFGAPKTILLLPQKVSFFFGNLPHSYNHSDIRIFHYTILSLQGWLLFMLSIRGRLLSLSKFFFQTPQIFAFQLTPGRDLFNYLTSFTKLYVCVCLCVICVKRVVQSRKRKKNLIYPCLFQGHTTSFLFHAENSCPCEFFADEAFKGFRRDL